MLGGILLRLPTRAGWLAVTGFFAPEFVCRRASEDGDIVEDNGG